MIKAESVDWIPQSRALSILDGEELDINDDEDGTIPSVRIYLLRILGCY